MASRTPEWYKMQTSKNCPDDLRIQLTVRMDKPNNLKYCGYCHAVGRTAFKKWRKRYICLIQVGAKRFTRYFCIYIYIYIHSSTFEGSNNF